MRRLRRCGGWAGMTLAGMILTTVPHALEGQTQWDVLLHGSTLSYLDSQVKEEGYSVGAYGTFGAHWMHLVEVGATFTNIKYLSGYTLEQADLTAAYTRFWPRGSARVGGHAVSSNDPSADGGVVVFGGASAYKVGVWSAGAEGALSSYSDFGSGGLRVAQLTPSAGFTRGDGSGTRFLSGIIRGYYINLSDDLSADWGLEGRSFLSVETSVSITSGSVTVSGFAWGGEQAFAVRQGGFLVFNVAELRTGGYGGGLRWVVSPGSAVSAGLYIERFEDMSLGGTGVGAAARARTLTVSVGFTL